METKLTLQMDQSVILSAKEYADSRHRSLSKIVENYFRNLTQKPSPEKKFSPVVEGLLGAVSKEEVKKLYKLAETDERLQRILGGK
ncbi:conserved hypothetical protein [Treponema primitia ZAS-2]|jgi:hypothetical protein|uniref:Antitoxin n=1 Tax=Treponema primitia (strain ATCC BAA-887 / DSM 12427 / ZAS-2) TaxID=545694 RepID=F5YLT1_TREPZ|nr:DUF6364 family protein [Treponema primitia]AEF84076.1 conserved hypothetical protein [Treponema primitia ZAS-2]